MMKARWTKGLVSCCLLGILSEGYAGHVIKWTSEEDSIIVKFIQDTTENPSLEWQYCADIVNQWLETNGLLYRRTAEGCCKHWDRHLKKYQGCSQLHKLRSPVRRLWTGDENNQFMESVKRHTHNGWTNWEAVARDMGDRSAAQCRAHYKVLALHGFSFEEAPKGVEPQGGGEFTSMGPNPLVYDDFEEPFGGLFFGDI
ncbi:MAG: SANT/Myb domain-containing protein [Puniceicoccales bacterium]|jgi:hypothetical protein|nr:SANT/Myb domain-containing protein [Puniceicoccales bacterium]